MSNASHVWAPRPSSIQSKSFSRYEPPLERIPPSRHRATTVQAGAFPEILSPEKISRGLSREGDAAYQADVFEQSSSPAQRPTKTLDAFSDPLSESLPEDFDQLPIELISLVDR